MAAGSNPQLGLRLGAVAELCRLAGQSGATILRAGTLAISESLGGCEVNLVREHALFVRCVDRHERALVLATLLFERCGVPIDLLFLHLLLFVEVGRVKDLARYLPLAGLMYLP